MTMLTPEIIFRITGKDLLFGYTNIQPKLPRLEVRFEPILKVAFKIGDIESVLVELKDVGQNVPGISNGVFLRGQLFKTVPERRVACYLEVIAK
jgi:hypothetical protein